MPGITSLPFYPPFQPPPEVVVFVATTTGSGSLTGSGGGVALEFVLEWAQLRMTFRTYSESSLGLSSQAALDVQAGLSAGIRAPEIGLGAEHLRANAMDATVRVGETLDVFARESAAMVTTDFTLKAGDNVDMLVQGATNVVTNTLAVDALDSVGVSAENILLKSSESLSAMADGPVAAGSCLRWYSSIASWT